MSELEQVFFETAAELRSWLSRHHDRTDSVWLVKWKKSPDKPFLNYDAIVDELLCFGWVDSLPRKLDEHKTMLRISPRNTKSNWSKINKDRVSRLLSAGKMHEAGIKLIEEAKRNGRWDFLNDVENLVIPPDLKDALQSHSKALFYFNRFPPSSKRGILEWIKTAKQEATRSKRIEETAIKAAQNLKANHPKGRDQGPKE